jgi:phosphatidylserine decarboxylase
MILYTVFWKNSINNFIFSNKLITMKDLINHLPSINKEGYIFIAIFLIATLLAFVLSKTLGCLLLILTVWCVCFFRDPERVSPPGEGLILSPADGRIDAIVKSPPPPELSMKDEPLTRVSIFLSVFDVHVNRIPIAGKIKALHYHPGKFFSATLDKASELNERQSILIETEAGTEIAVTQIAGLIARRIICNLDEKQTVIAGERFGIIRFGSRVDIYLPKGVELIVYPGQLMVGGETVIARLGSSEKPKSERSKSDNKSKK